ncbi:unnamed protein product [Brassica oleracea var. botrytis]|uniref:J domain-containing protein n=1 Tax=Brassica oleracea TaxID=3712 RepID=A0A3P6ESL3_BRAOL|nr:unnamed protein product [Brassica oleracea]
MEEAKRAIKIAEVKVLENNYKGAKRFTDKAKNLCPTLDDTLADDEAVKKQYKKLALLPHPDKNRLNGAEGAFKLVLDAWSLLSDKAKRVSYDHQKRKKKEKKSEPEPPPPPAAAATREDHPKRRFKKTEKRAHGRRRQARRKKKRRLHLHRKRRRRRK